MRSDDAVEAAVLAHRVGETFQAIVVARYDKGIQVQLRDVAVLANCSGTAQPGDVVQVKLVATDIAQHRVTFDLVAAADPSH